MNVDVERGFAAVIRYALPGTTVREATNSQQMPADAQMLVVECPECEHVAGPLYRATVKVYLGTPAFEMSEARHREAIGSLTTSLLDTMAAAAIFDPVAGGLTLHGFHVRSQSEEIVENTWRSTIELVAGICLG